MEQVEMYESEDFRHLLHMVRPEDNDWFALILPGDMVLMLENSRFDERCVLVE